MSTIEILLKEIEQEAQNTRKMLSIVPNDKYDWQPHPKSMTIRQLATHIAELPSWIPLGINTEVLDFATGDYKPTPIDNNKELMKAFEDNQKLALESLSKTNDEYFKYLIIALLVTFGRMDSSLYTHPV